STSQSTVHTYPLSLHDALPISLIDEAHVARHIAGEEHGFPCRLVLGQYDRRRVGKILPAFGLPAHAKDHLGAPDGKTGPAHREADRKSTRLNSSHVKISYAVFC